MRAANAAELAVRDGPRHGSLSTSPEAEAHGRRWLTAIETEPPHKDPQKFSCFVFAAQTAVPRGVAAEIEIRARWRSAAGGGFPGQR